MDEYDKKRAFGYAIKLLSMRDYSEKILRRKIIEKKYPAPIADKVIEDIKDLGYLKEDLFLEARIKAFMHKGYSQNFIYQKIKLESHLITEELISKIFQEHQITEHHQIHMLLQKKYRPSPQTPDEAPISFEEKQKVSQKLARFLMSKGHSPSLIFGAIKELFKN